MANVPSEVRLKRLKTDLERIQLDEQREKEKVKNDILKEKQTIQATMQEKKKLIQQLEENLGCNEKKLTSARAKHSCALKTLAILQADVTSLETAHKSDNGALLHAKAGIHGLDIRLQKIDERLHENVNEVGKEFEKKRKDCMGEIKRTIKHLKMHLDSYEELQKSMESANTIPNLMNADLLETEKLTDPPDTSDALQLPSEKADYKTKFLELEKEHALLKALDAYHSAKPDPDGGDEWLEELTGNLGKCLVDKPATLGARPVVIKKIVGSGRSSIVLMVEYCDGDVDNNMCIVKLFRLKGYDQRKIWKFATEELERLTTVYDDTPTEAKISPKPGEVLQLHLAGKEMCCITMEFIPSCFKDTTNLKDSKTFLSDDDKKHVYEATINNIVTLLHAGILHGDIKADNMIVGSKMRFFFIDLNRSVKAVPENFHRLIKDLVDALYMTAKLFNMKRNTDTEEDNYAALKRFKSEIAESTHPFLGVMNRVQKGVFEQPSFKALVDWCDDNFRSQSLPLHQWFENMTAVPKGVRRTECEEIQDELLPAKTNCFKVLERFLQHPVELLPHDDNALVTKCPEFASSLRQIRPPRHPTEQHNGLRLVQAALQDTKEFVNGNDGKEILKKCTDLTDRFLFWCAFLVESLVTIQLSHKEGALSETRKPMMQLYMLLWLQQILDSGFEPSDLYEHLTRYGPCQVLNQIRKDERAIDPLRTLTWQVQQILDGFPSGFLVQQPLKIERSFLNELTLWLTANALSLLLTQEFTDENGYTCPCPPTSDQFQVVKCPDRCPPAVYLGHIRPFLRTPYLFEPPLSEDDNLFDLLLARFQNEGVNNVTVYPGCGPSTQVMRIYNLASLQFNLNLICKTMRLLPDGNVWIFDGVKSHEQLYAVPLNDGKQVLYLETSQKEEVATPRRLAELCVFSTNPAVQGEVRNAVILAFGEENLDSSEVVKSISHRIIQDDYETCAPTYDDSDTSGCVEPTDGTVEMIAQEHKTFVHEIKKAVPDLKDFTSGVVVLVKAPEGLVVVFKAPKGKIKMAIFSLHSARVDEIYPPRPSMNSSLEHHLKRALKELAGKHDMKAVVGEYIGHVPSSI